jgi:hypothetical protein
MVASPSDVFQERGIVRNVIAEWNAVHASDRKTILMPIAWETHATPDMGDRPQAIINGQLLKDADLLVAMFWTRIGSPTGVAKSGTVEEIEEHIRAGKPAMIYFSSAPVRPDSIDDNQYRLLREFKESMQKRGLYEEYENLSDFHTKFTRQLAQKIISRFPSAVERAGNGVALNFESQGPPQQPEMGTSARDLLFEASKDPQGVILSIQTLQGSHVQTNGREFVEQRGGRAEAQWRSAVAELDKLGLVEDRAGKGEVYFVTEKGYRTADLLKQQ